MENKPMKALVIDFLEYTTIHGLGRLSATRFWIQKILWVLAFLSSLAIVGYTTHNLYQQFSSLPISTVTSFEQKSQTFPTIRICNLNVIPFSKVKADKKLTQIVKAASQLTGTELDQSQFLNYTDASPIIVPKNEDQALRILKTMFTLRAYDIQVTDVNEINSTGLIVECIFNTFACYADKSDIAMVPSPDLGSLCHEFKLPEKIKTPGPSFGLQLIVNVHQQDYVPIFSRSAGVNIFIGNDDSFQVPTGFDVDIGLSVVIHNRLHGSTKRCSDSETTIADCFKNCTSAIASCNCECRWKTWNCSGKYEMACSTFKQFSCIESEVHGSSEEGECSHCSVPCHEQTYKRTVSMSKWPAMSYEQILANKLEKKNISVVESKDNLLAIQIYFSSLIVETATEVYSYTIVNFVSDIGGQLGLWIGVSILSLLEVLELVGLLTLKICQRNKLRISQRQEVISKLGKDHPDQPEVKQVQD